jgi:SAM-dependent methyltransferase
MSSYLSYLESLYDKKTFDRKLEYIKHNFSSYVKRGQTVLEIGPGIGEFIKYLNNQGNYDIDIVDIDKETIDYVKKRYKIKEAYLIRNFKQVEKRLRKYDLIYMSQVLEHIQKKDHEYYIKTLFKHLNKNGNILITVPNGGNPFNIVERYWDITHELVFTENAFLQLIRFCDLKNYELLIQGYRIPPYTPLNLIRIILQKILHLAIKTILMINGGVYSNLLYPNISLIIKKIK